MEKKDAVCKKVVEFGARGTKFYRMLFLDFLGVEISPWHKVSLHAENELLHFVCTSPRNSNTRFEVSNDEWFNPLRLHLRRKKGSTGVPYTFSQNLQWNFGFLPQTIKRTRSCSTSAEKVKTKKNYPVEVLEIGSSKARRVGEIYTVKPLAALPTINKLGQISWIIVAIDPEESMSAILNNAIDLQGNFPSILEEMREWLRSWRRDDPNVEPSVVEQASGLPTLDTIISNAHKMWTSFIETEPPLLELNLPLPRPITPDVYESLWKKYTRSPDSLTSTPSSSPLISWSSGLYEQAWAETQSCATDKHEGLSKTEPSTPKSRFPSSLILRRDLKSLAISPLKGCSPLSKWLLKKGTTNNSKIKFNPAESITSPRDDLFEKKDVSPSGLGPRLNCMDHDTHFGQLSSRGSLTSASSEATFTFDSEFFQVETPKNHGVDQDVLSNDGDKAPAASHQLKRAFRFSSPDLTSLDSTTKPLSPLSHFKLAKMKLILCRLRLFRYFT